MRQSYQVLNEKKLFEGAVFDVNEREIEVRVPNGDGVDEVHAITRQVVDYADSVLIVPVTVDSNYMLMGEEYRTVVNGTQIGFPAGRIDAEDVQYVNAVHRELREELGVLMAEGTSPVHLFSAHASLGYTLEQIHTYLVYVDDENRTDTDFDHDEYVELRKVKITDVEDMIRNGILTSMAGQLAYKKALEYLASVNGDILMSKSDEDSTTEED